MAESKGASQRKTSPKPKPAGRTRQTPAAKASATPSDIPALEWAAAAVGLVATVAVVAVIGWEALSGGDGPPWMQITLQRVVPAGDGYVAQFEIANRGERPAAQVVVEGVLTPAQGKPETAEAVFDYVPDRSTRAGGLFFHSDPRAGSLELRAKGFTDP